MVSPSWMVSDFVERMRTLRSSCKRASSGSSVISSAGSVTSSGSVGSSSGSSGNTETQKKAAYDSASFQNTVQNENYGNSSNSTNVRGSDTLHSSDSNDVTNTEIKQGNQGVTMSQEMLLSEFNAWKWNLYDHIADVFINEFCIMMYD